MIGSLLGSIGGGRPLAPALALLAGVLLGLSPVALPAVPVAMSVLSSGRVEDGRRSGASWWRTVPTVAAFVVGMDGVLAVASYLFVQVTVVLARGAVALNLVAAVLLAVLGLRLLLRRTSLCAQATGFHRARPRPSARGCCSPCPAVPAARRSRSASGAPLRSPAVRCWRWSPSPHSSPDAPRS